MNIFVHLIPRLNATCVKSFLILPQLCYAISTSTMNTCMNVMFVPVDSSLLVNYRNTNELTRHRVIGYALNPDVGRDLNVSWSLMLI